MNGVNSSPAFERRHAAILFCEVSSFDGFGNDSRNIPPAELLDEFDGIFQRLVARHNGTYVNRIQESFIAVFDAAQVATELALDLQNALINHPVCVEEQRARAKIFIHYSDVVVRKTRKGIGVEGDGIRLVARLIPLIPEGGLGLSDEAKDKLPPDIAEGFEKQSADSKRRGVEGFLSDVLDGRTVWLRMPMALDSPSALSTGLKTRYVPRLIAAPSPSQNKNVTETFASAAMANLASEVLQKNRIAGQAPPPSPESEPAEGGLTRFLRSLKPQPRQPVKTAPLGLDLSPATIDCVSEAIVVIDIVQATATSDLFGWYAVGRRLVREMRSMVREIGEPHGLTCMKSTGDGLLLTFRDDSAADLAAINAVQASLDLLRRLSGRNAATSEERQIAVRLALHFGEVDILPNDREGPNVSFTFRVEAINRASLTQALNPIESSLLPVRDYIICSERISDIVGRRKPELCKTSCGLFKLKGFSGWWELFLISENPYLD